MQEPFLALSPGNSAVSLNHFQLHKRLSGSLRRPLSSEAPQPENASLPACGAGPWRPRGWLVGGSLPLPQGQSCHPSDPSRLTVSPYSSHLEGLEGGVHALSGRRRTGRPAESFRLSPDPEIAAIGAPQHQEGARRCQTRGSAASGEAVTDANFPFRCCVALQLPTLSPKHT